MTRAAKSVETEEQMKIVRALGCCEMQGYLSDFHLIEAMKHAIIYT